MTTDLLTRPETNRLWTPADLEIADAATRREFMAGVLGAGALILAGCGENDAGDPASRTRRVRHAFGTTEVPVTPQRVVAFANTAADVALALDVEGRRRRALGHVRLPHGWWPRGRVVRQARRAQPGGDRRTGARSDRGLLRRRAVRPPVEDRAVGGGELRGWRRRVAALRP